MRLAEKTNPQTNVRVRLIPSRPSFNAIRSSSMALLRHHAGRARDLTDAATAKAELQCTGGTCDQDEATVQGTRIGRQGSTGEFVVVNRRAERHDGTPISTHPARAATSICAKAST
jgi:hypothetical protein